MKSNLFLNANGILASTGIAQVDNGMNKLKLLGIGLVSAIGIIVLIKGGLDLGTALKDRDSSGMGTAAGEIAGGIVMCAIGAVIAFLGF